MYTRENVLHFLHLLSVMVWFGGVLSLNALAIRVGRGPDRTVQASLLHQSDLYGRLVIAPAGGLTLITGLWLVAEQDAAWSAFWVVWGIAGLAASVILGSTLIRATNADLRQLIQNPSTDEPRRLARQRRVALLYGVNLLLLLSIIWVMVFKPSL